MLGIKGVIGKPVMNAIRVQFGDPLLDGGITSIVSSWY